MLCSSWLRVPSATYDVVYTMLKQEAAQCCGEADIGAYIDREGLRWLAAARRDCKDDEFVEFVGYWWNRQRVMVVGAVKMKEVR